MRVALKRLCSTIDRGSTPTYSDTDAGSALVIGQSCQTSSGEFAPSLGRWHEGPVPAKGRLQGGEILINSTGTGTLGRVALVKALPESVPVFVDSHVTMLRFIEDRANPRYMAYLMSLPSFRLFVEEGLSVGATKQQELNLEALRAYNVTLLPLRQQGLVADFLDRKCARTRQLVGEIDGFISLTESASIEVVRRLVTGAHESDLVPVSGDWFTTIPRDWTVKPLGLVAKFDNGVAFKPEDWGSEGRPIIRIEHLNGAPLVHRTHRAVLKRAEIRTDDLLFAWSGNRGTSFGPHRWTGESPALLNQHIFKVSSQEDLGWLYWVLRAATLYVEEQAHGIIGMVHITKRRLTKIRVPVPPRIIQVELAKRLDDDSARQWLLRREFAALKEQLVSYRDAQIVEAVTGGLPVEQVSERPGLASTAAER